MMQRTAFAYRATRFIPLAALVVAGGCFATRNDVRVVQTDIASMRTEMLKNNADQRDALAAAMRIIQIASDSVKVMSNRLTAVQGDVRGGLRTVDERLGQVMELLNQSARTIGRLRADAEARANQAGTAPPPVGGSTGGTNGTDTTRAVPPVQTTGPNELYASGIKNMNGGSTSTARQAFMELLDKYPTSDLAPGAQLYVAQSYAQEKNVAAAIPAFSAVVAKYPNSPEAPTALYKKALLLIDQGKTAEAKPLLQQIVSKYPNSDIVLQAKELLDRLK